MPPRPVVSSPASARQRAFSLTELLVAVGLLSVLILALYAMFDQTQRALRGSVGQVDVFEGSRTALDLLTRDLEAARPAGIDDGPHFLTRLAAPPSLITGQGLLFRDRQPVLEEFFALKWVADNRWSVFGYFIGTEEDPRQRATPPIGTLYRYEDRIFLNRRYTGSERELEEFELVRPSQTAVHLSTRTPLAADLLARNLLRLPYNYAREFRAPVNASRVMDGVLNFRLVPYDHLGRPYNVFYPTNELPVRPFTPVAAGTQPLPPVILNPVVEGVVTETTFSGQAMPAYVEVELDVLEPRLLDQYRALPENPVIRNRFLTNNLARIQSFRERIPLRASIR